jgi:uncharacterized integral membrane protein (TIGR00698 family)
LLVLLTGIVFAYAINRVVPVISALTVAVFLGALARNIGLLTPALLHGITFATRPLLRGGVVLLGLQLALGQVLGLGAGRIAIVVTTVIVTFLGTQWLGPRLGLSHNCTLLVATGVSICGASAVAAMNGVAEGEEEEVATAIALITLYGSLAIVLLPLLQSPLGLSQAEYGTWVGASVHEVAQVVAAATPAGPIALAVAVVVKLTRVILLAPLVAGVSILRHREAHATTRPPILPMFVVGFIGMVGVRSSGMLPIELLSAAKIAATLLLTGALFGLGSSVQLSALVRTGGQATVLGGAATLLAASTALAGVELMAIL